MTFTEALKREFGDNLFSVADVANSSIPFSLFPATVQASARKGVDLTLSLGHVFSDVPGVKRIGRNRFGYLWSVES